MKKALKILAIIIALMIIIPAGILIYAFTTDFSSWRGYIEEKASAALERPVTIGAFSLSLGGSSHIYIQDLVIAEKAGDPLTRLRLDKAESRFELWPLIGGQFIADSLVVEGLDIVATAPPQPAPQAGAAGNKRDEDRHDDIDIGGGLDGFTLPLVRTMQLSDISFAMNNADGSPPVTAQINSASLVQNEAGESTLTLDGSALGNQLTAMGEFGSLAAINNDGLDWPFTLAVKNKAINLGINGTASDPIHLENLNAAITVSSPDIARLLTLAGIANFPAIGGADIAFSLAGKDLEAVAMRDINIALGRQDSMRLDVKGQIYQLAAPFDFDMGFSFGLADLQLINKMAASLASLPALAAQIPAGLINQPLPAETFSLAGRVQGGLDDRLSLSKLTMTYGNRSGKALIAITGKVQDVLEASGIDLNIAGGAPTMAALRPTVKAFADDSAFGPSFWQIQNPQIEGAISGDVSGVIRLDNLNLRLAGSDIGLTATHKMGKGGSVSEADILLSSKLIKLDQLSGLMGGASSKAAPATSQKASTSNNAAKADEGLNEFLENYKIAINANLQRLEGWGLHIGNLAIKGNIDKGVANFPALNAKIGQSGVLQSDLRYDIIKQNGASHLYMAGFDLQREFSGLFDNIPSQYKSYFTGPRALSTKLECFAVNLDLASTALASKDGFIATPDFMALFDGGVNYQNMGLNLDVTPKLQGFAIPFRITGSVSDPKIGLAPEKAAISLGKNLVMGGGKLQGQSWADMVTDTQKELTTSHSCQPWLASARDNPPSKSASDLMNTQSNQSPVQGVIDNLLGGSKNGGDNSGNNDIKRGIGDLLKKVLP